jgi:hypothetical protein
VKPNVDVSLLTDTAKKEVNEPTENDILNLLGVLITLLKMHPGMALLKTVNFVRRTSTQTLLRSMFHTDMTRMRNHVNIQRRRGIKGNE